jgi:hypothetical protein
VRHVAGDITGVRGIIASPVTPPRWRSLAVRP